MWYMRASSKLKTFEMPDAINVAGVDEAGRGPWAGPVVAAAVILDPQRPIEGLDDSKALTARRRDALAVLIRARAHAWAIGLAEVGEIDRLNIRRATHLAMQRAVAGLAVAPELVRVDGNDSPVFACISEAVVSGDSLVPAISAASILAKTHRDALMHALDLAHPGYGFARHKGYGTREHAEALQRLGPCPLHRRSFKPVQACAVAFMKS
jgi:ribonuclease HII